MCLLLTIWSVLWQYMFGLLKAMAMLRVHLFDGIQTYTCSVYTVVDVKISEHRTEFVPKIYVALQHPRNPVQRQWGHQLYERTSI